MCVCVRMFVLGAPVVFGEAKGKPPILGCPYSETNPYVDLKGGYMSVFPLGLDTPRLDSKKETNKNSPIRYFWRNPYSPCEFPSGVMIESKF